MNTRQKPQNLNFDFLLKVNPRLLLALILGKKNKTDTEANRPMKPPNLLGTERKIP